MAHAAAVQRGDPEMRVLFFPSSYAPMVGGLQTVVQTLVQHFHERQHEVRVVTNRYPRSLNAREEIDGVTVDRILMLRPRLDQLRRNRHDLFLASLYYGPSSYRRLKKICHEFKPDVINVHFPDHQIPFILRLRRDFKFKLVVSLHGHDVERVFENHNAYGQHSVDALRMMLREADSVTAVSRHLLERACQIEPAIANKSHVIYNGINFDRYRSAAAYRHARPYILGLGRLTENKGFDLLLDAFAAAGAEERFDLIIAGDGDQCDSLKSQASKLGMTDRVHFLGAVAPPDVPALLKGSTIVTVPSRKEGFGIVALEAVATGKPLLATATGGLKEFLDQLKQSSNGHTPKITIAEPTVSDLTDNLREIMQSLSSSNGNGFSMPEIYSTQHVASRYEAIMAQ